MTLSAANKKRFLRPGPGRPRKWAGRGHFGGEAHRQFAPTRKHLELAAASQGLPTETTETAQETADTLLSSPRWDDGGSEASQQSAGERSPRTVND